MKLISALLALSIASAANIRGTEEERRLQVPDTELLRSVNWADSPIFDRVSRLCNMCHNLDFNMTDAFVPAARGAYVSTEWRSKGVRILASGGFTPDNKARIFDTSNPGTNNDNGDPDLGSPNANCATPGPGMGSGGQPTKRGENCIEGVGNVLIVQESDKVDPDDNARGGSITFEFAIPTLVTDIGVMDIDETQQTLIITKAPGNQMRTVTYEGFGDNAVQRVLINESLVTKIEVLFPGSGAVIDLNFCPGCNPFFQGGAAR